MQCDWRRAFGAIFCVAATLMLPAQVQAAGGAFAVDDAEIDAPGSCKIDSWVAFASNKEFGAIVAPACVVNLGIPIELGGELGRSRADDIWGTGGAVSAKVNLIPVDKHPFGLGLVMGKSWDLITGTHSGAFITLPATVALGADVRVNLNIGWQHNGTTKLNYLTWGAGFEWNFVKPLTLIGEVYGLAGNLPSVEPGDPPSPNSIREPRTQLGLRYTPKDNIDFDVIWGRNIGGENAHWITTGINLRF